MLWACIALPHLALDSVLRRSADPARPLALVHGPAHLRSVRAVNAAAAAAGLKPGMRLGAAHALCAEAVFVESDPAQERADRAMLAHWAYRHSSLVSLQDEDAIVLEVRASFRLFGEWPQLQARLREELTQLGFAHALALAPTPRAARVFARLRDGLAIANPATLPDVLDRVPTRRAGLPDDAGARLHDMGARTLADVRRLPRAGLRRRFGAALLEHLDRLYGEADDPLDFFVPPDRFEARIELGYEVESHQALLFPLRRLTGDLAVHLSARDGGVQRFVLRLEHDRAHTDVEVGLLAPERDAALLFDIARHRLEQASLPAAAIGVRLIAEELPPFVPPSRDLFDTRPAQAVSWPQLRERLRARLGDGAVYRLAATGDPRPERAWRKAGVDEDAACAALAPSRPPRPALLLDRPVPLRDHGLRILAGPERLESGWWDGDDQRRDYYILETSQGQRAWAFVPAGERDGWMLHGWFA